MVRLNDSVFQFPNFLSEDECDNLMQVINSYPEEAWYDDGSTGHWAGRNLHLRNEDRNVLVEIQNKVESNFDSYSNIQPIGLIHRIVEGTGGIDLHNDNGQPQDKDNAFGVVIYINDDYVGGEIEYPSLYIDHKPERGSMIVHNASLMHLVKPVKSGTRYMLTTFIAGNDERPAKLGTL